MTPVEQLRAAATRLREVASLAPAGPWQFVVDLYWERSAIMTDGRVGWDVLVMDVHNDSEHPAARWAALVHPGLAEPLAAWLEEEARQYNLPPCDDPSVCNRCEWHPSTLAALAVARVINEGVLCGGRTVGDGGEAGGGAAGTADDLQQPAEAGAITPVTRVRVREVNTPASNKPDMSDCGTAERTADPTAITAIHQSRR